MHAMQAALLASQLCDNPALVSRVAAEDPVTWHVTCGRSKHSKDNRKLGSACQEGLHFALWSAAANRKQQCYSVAHCEAKDAN